MSAKLSRRYGRVCLSPPLSDLPLEERFLLNHLTLDRRTEFEDLPPRYQQLLLEAEADLERYRAEVEAARAADSVPAAAGGG